MLCNSFITTLCLFLSRVRLRAASSTTKSMLSHTLLNSFCRSSNSFFFLFKSAIFVFKLSISFLSCSSKAFIDEYYKNVQLKYSSMGIHPAKNIWGGSACNMNRYMPSFFGSFLGELLLNLMPWDNFFW